MGFGSLGVLEGDGLLAEGVEEHLGGARVRVKGEGEGEGEG